jgi:O-antigen biosynthesis protein
VKISIFTPSHNNKYLSELYGSIKNQDFYEWVILAQNIDVPDFKDPRVKIITYPVFGEAYVGALKLQACKHCTGDIFLEVDHDDLLTSTAIEECKKAFEDPEVGFAYSDSANFKGNFEKTDRYNAAHGWKYTEFSFIIEDGSIVDKTKFLKENPPEGNLDGRVWKLLECHLGFAATPASTSKIWYAPNHFRAWRSDVYWKTGGHNPRMRVLDDQDLVMKTFQITKFKFVPKCLYLYRVDGNNTWLKNNKEIQENTMRLYDENIESLSLKWAENHNLLKLDLGGRFNKDKRYLSVDLKDCDIKLDLNGDWSTFGDNSVGVIRANDVLEHLKDPIEVMKKIYRVLVPGGYCFIRVPSTDGRGAWQDPTHVSFWNENSFLYYTDKLWAQYIDTPVKFQELRRYTTEKNNIGVNWVVCHLLKLVDGMQRPPGIINI